MQIPTAVFDSDRDITSIFNLIDTALEPCLRKRDNKFERQIVTKLDEDRVGLYEDSFVVRRSKFDMFDCMNLPTLPVSKQIACLYRDRLYFFHSKDE